jgi:hypothetical protein
MSSGQAAFPVAPFLDGFPGLERCLMHTRSKRYLRRHRARLRAQRRTSLKPFLQCENRLVQKMAVRAHSLRDLPAFPPPPPKPSSSTLIRTAVRAAMVQRRRIAGKAVCDGPTKAGPIAAATRRRSRFAEPDPQTSLVLNRHRNDRPPPGGLLLSRLGGPTCAS